MLVSLEAAGQQLAVSVQDRRGPRLLHWGPPLPDASFDEALPDALPSSPDIRVDHELFPVEGYGHFGEPALLAFTERGCIFDLSLDDIEQSGSRVALQYVDSRQAIKLKVELGLDPSGLLIGSSELRNDGKSDLTLQRLNALTLPLPAWVRSVDASHGSWANEGHASRIALAGGKFEQTGRAGRPGFGGGPHLVLSDGTASADRGRMFAIALAHSGNFTLGAERFMAGDGQAFAAEWLHPGEIRLGPGEVYQTPKALAARSDRGLNGISDQFHAYARSIAPPTRAHRPVQLNSWEAAYFDIDEKRAIELAKSAAELGAERFVLDDGWFRGRTDDRRALGDWTPDPERFPNGLGRLAQEVKALGLEFGLWVEPEMVSEDSDLFRAHPDWILTADGQSGPTGRNQLVLDLSRAEIQDHVFGVLDDLLREAPIQYLKWDCNRDLFPAATPSGPATHRQIKGLYAILDQLRAAHPDVSIESCASGGGRIDYGVASRADRFWPSDATDAAERIRIQDRASLFYPLEMLGAHIGSSPNHITGRRFSMLFRCLVAFFGHFGVELDPWSLSEQDGATLRHAITIWKTHRSLVSTGRLVRIETGDDGLVADMIVAPDQRSSLLRVLRTATTSGLVRPPLQFDGPLQGGTWRLDELDLRTGARTCLDDTLTTQKMQDIGLDLAPARVLQGRLFALELVA